MSLKQISKLSTIIGIILTLVFFIWCFKSGILTDESKMQEFLKQFGLASFLIFIILQIIQVVFPIIPGGLGCLVGVLVFGAWKGFLCNYIGICLGSIIAFLIAKYYGKPLMHELFDEKLINKYEGWTEKHNRFTKLFAAAIFFPIAPDDFLCYLAGTTKMKLRTFTLIILLGKPASIALYSMGLNVVFKNAMALLPF